jgi:FkbM family methyltransferase
MLETRGALTTSRGLSIEFLPDDYQIRPRVEQVGQWEEDVAKAIDKFLKPGWTMLDLGAHVGYFSVQAARRGNPVIAIEPNPDAVELLRKNAEANGVAEYITVINAAIADSYEYAHMAVTPGFEGAPGTMRLGPSGKRVNVLRARDLLSVRPEFIKIDIEGLDHRVLADMPEVLDAAEVVVFEVSGECRNYGSKPTDIVDLLRSRGFIVTYMNGLQLNDDWAELMESVPNGYLNLLARKHPELATRATVLLCAWREMKLATAECLIQLRDLGWGYAIIGGDALITRSRAKTVSNWYRQCADEDVFLMLDDDVVFKPEDAAKVVELARKTRSIACGAYPVKDGGHLACRRFVGQDIYFGPDSPPVEIEYAATGFMAVHRDVLTAMIEAKHPDGEPVFPFVDHKGLSPFWPFFDTFNIKHNAGTPEEYYDPLSEDYAFCEQARRLGFKVWLDPSVILFHLGMYPYNVHNMKGVVSADGLPDAS